MELLYPIPERWHPRAGHTVTAPAAEPGAEPVDERPFRAERGYVQGVVDLVFEHEGRTYLVDWKSDRLPTYDAATVDAHVAAHYALQARLYTLGVLRLLALGGASPEARFGGLLYCFLRGMGGEDGTAVWFLRPAGTELSAWEDELRARREWGRAEDPA
jgi:exodeoxyribonuclease V beta subunit